jgi:hypothetical protein
MGSPGNHGNWYHIVGSTHGTWLRGDERGFRTYRHRFHVEGDYRDPPPDRVYSPILARTRNALRHPPVLLDANQRRIVCQALRDRLIDKGCELVALAVVSNHFHLLARFAHMDQQQRDRAGHTILRDGRDPSPRYFVGLARKHASFELKRAGLKPDGPVWAARPKVIPIKTRRQQISTARYIERHVEQAAAVWYFRYGFSFVVEDEGSR